MQNQVVLSKFDLTPSACLKDLNNLGSFLPSLKHIFVNQIGGEVVSLVESPLTAGAQERGGGVEPLGACSA